MKRKRQVSRDARPPLGVSPYKTLAPVLREWSWYLEIWTIELNFSTIAKSESSGLTLMEAHLKTGRSVPLRS